MDWGNAIVKKLCLRKDETILELSLNLEGDFKKTKKKLTWLSEGKPGIDHYAPVKAVIVEYDHLITKKALSDKDTLEDFINKNSELRTDVVDRKSVV